MAFIQQYCNFVESLLKSTRGDNVILMITIVMTLFSPDRVGLRSASVHCVTRIQEQYASVLREYIDARYNADRTMMAQILQRLVDIRNINEQHTSMLLNLKLEDLEPLIAEVFDL
jgi:hypothetical protein